jgi:hypothetical protein
MRELAHIAVYLLTIGALSWTLISGAIWLATPDPSLAKADTRRPAPIPPRIAESIERKAIPFKPQEPEASVLRPVSAPVMQSAPVSLPTPVVKPRQAARKKPAGKRTEPTTAALAEPVSVARPITARTDTPF